MATPDLTRLLTGFQGQLVMNPTLLGTKYPPPSTDNTIDAQLQQVGTGNCTAGVHQIGYAYVYGSGSGDVSPMLLNTSVTIPSNPPPGPTGYHVNLDLFFTGVPSGAQSINVYVGLAGGSTSGPFYLLENVPVTSGVTFYNLDDAALALLPLANLPIVTSDVEAGFPFGGVQLGEVTDVVVTPRRMTRDLKAEEYGSETIEVVDAGESWKLTCALRGVDPDLYNLVMAQPVTTTGLSGRPLYEYPGSATQAGAFLTQRSNMPFSLLLIPKDATRLPSFLFFAVIPVLDASARLTLQLDREGTFGAVLYCLRANAPGQARDKQVVQWGMLEDLSTV